MQTLITILILVTSFPIGYLLAYLTKDELIDGRKYFIVVAIIGLILSLIFGFLGKLVIVLTLFYMVIVSLICIWKSYDAKFVKI